MNLCGSALSLGCWQLSWLGLWCFLFGEEKILWRAHAKWRPRTRTTLLTNLIVTWHYLPPPYVGGYKSGRLTVAALRCSESSARTGNKGISNWKGVAVEDYSGKAQEDRLVNNA
jgi:hypothetical protein